MPNPSLRCHYKPFITTTVRSAAIASPQLMVTTSPLTVLQRDNDFTCSDIPPVLHSCQLNPGSDTTDNPVIVVLCLGCKRTHPIFTPSCPFGASSLVHSRSALQDLTAGIFIPAFKPIAHHHIVSFAAAWAVLKTPPEGRLREAGLNLIRLSHRYISMPQSCFKAL